jgi:Na+-transporting methylmalonyl-CoA/oxaloacetate decarboxylase beta subunit
MDKKKRIVLNIGIKIILLSVVITVNYFVIKHFGYNVKEASAVTIIGDENRPTTIYISAKFNMINLLKYSLSIILGINTLILITFNILELVKNKAYDIKNKFKIVLGINLRIIIALIIETVIYSLVPSFAMLGNIILISILLIILYFKK